MDPGSAFPSLPHGSPLLLDDVKAELREAMLRICRRLPVRPLLYLPSSSPITDSDPFKPMQRYGLTPKDIAEAYIHSTFAGERGFGPDGLSEAEMSFVWKDVQLHCRAYLFDTVFKALKTDLLASYLYLTTKKLRYSGYTLDNVFQGVCRSLDLSGTFPWGSCVNPSPYSSLGTSNAKESPKTSFQSNPPPGHPSNFPTPNSPQFVHHGAPRADIGSAGLPRSHTASTSTDPSYNRPTASGHSPVASNPHYQDSPSRTPPAAQPTPHTGQNGLNSHPPTVQPHQPQPASQDRNNYPNPSPHAHMHSQPHHQHPDPNSAPLQRNASPSAVADMSSFQHSHRAEMPNMDSYADSIVSSSHNGNSFQAHPPTPSAASLMEEQEIEKLKLECFRPASDSEIFEACHQLRKAPFTVDKNKVFVFTHGQSSNRYAALRTRIEGSEPVECNYPLFFTGPAPAFLRNMMLDGDGVLLSERNRIFATDHATVGRNKERYILICEGLKKLITAVSTPEAPSTDVQTNYAASILPMFLIERVL